MGHSARENEWLDYYKHFDYLTPENTRDGSHPRLREHQGSGRKAVILIHGLTDSPHFMSAIADVFFDTLGYNVYLPLLKGHGEITPKGMTYVKLEDWKANIDFALDYAKQKTDHISIGGLSAGGALSFYTAATDDRVTGSLYLFSAALDIAGGVRGVLGEVAERLLRTPIARVLDRMEKNKPLINNNPFRYARMDKGGAIQLSRLIKQTDKIMYNYKSKNEPFPKRVFAAHSPGDTAAHIDGAKAVQEIADPARFQMFTVPAIVRHASVVLKDPIYAQNASTDDSPLENANPYFNDMMDAMCKFAKEEELVS